MMVAASLKRCSSAKAVVQRRKVRLWNVACISLNSHQRGQLIFSCSVRCLSPDSSQLRLTTDEITATT